MPVRLAGGDVHHIAHLQALRCLAFRADEPGAEGDGEDLPALVRVPEGAGAGREADVVALGIMC